MFAARGSVVLYVLSYESAFPNYWNCELQHRHALEGLLEVMTHSQITAACWLTIPWGRVMQVPSPRQHFSSTIRSVVGSAEKDRREIMKLLIWTIFVYRTHQM